MKISYPTDKYIFSEYKMNYVIVKSDKNET